MSGGCGLLVPLCSMQTQAEMCSLLAIAFEFWGAFHPGKERKQQDQVKWWPGWSVHLQNNLRTGVQCPEPGGSQAFKSLQEALGFG